MASDRRQLGPYQILDPLGAGGMGEVYRARDSKLGRDVAIKMLPEHLMADPERRARFAREARVLATLNHPHIGAIYELEEIAGENALVLELVEGPTWQRDYSVARCRSSRLSPSHDKSPMPSRPLTRSTSFIAT